LKLRGFHYIEFIGNMKPDEGLSEWLNNVLELKKLRDKYANFLRKTETILKDTKAHSGLEVLPVLFEMGWDFYDIVTSDPTPPVELLPAWEGDKAVERMRTVRLMLYEKIEKYFKEINI